MNLKTFDSACIKLPGATLVIQWGDNHVWKIGAKVFAIGDAQTLVVKATPLAFEMLLEQGFGTRAPYLPRGNWVAVAWGAGLKDAEMLNHIRVSFDIVVKTLPKAARAQLQIPVC